MTTSPFLKPIDSIIGRAVGASCCGSTRSAPRWSRSRRSCARNIFPICAATLVPLEQLASLLVTPDAHLITLSDAFVGYVLPSKVHGCIASKKPILFVGSDRSDVHRLCLEQRGALPAGLSRRCGGMRRGSRESGRSDEARRAARIPGAV